MKDSEFSTPPMSGEDQTPFKEMVAEQPEPSQDGKSTESGRPSKKNKLLLFSLIGALVVIVILGVILVIIFRPAREEALAPTPSPLPSPITQATASGLPKNIGDRRGALEEQLQDLDLDETDLSFPIIDFEIEF